MEYFSIPWKYSVVQYEWPSNHRVFSGPVEGNIRDFNTTGHFTTYLHVQVFRLKESIRAVSTFKNNNYHKSFMSFTTGCKYEKSNYRLHSCKIITRNLQKKITRKLKKKIKKLAFKIINHSMPKLQDELCRSQETGTNSVFRCQAGLSSGEQTITSHSCHPQIN